MKENKEIEARKKETSRRTFLKKTVYAAPTLLVLGALARPTSAKAGFGPPPEGASFIDVPNP